MGKGHADDTVLHLFDTPRLMGRAEGPTFPARGFLLCAILLLSAPGKVTRQSAATLMWEDADEGKALGNLRQVLVRMRKAWPSSLPPLVETSGALLLPGAGLEHSDLSRFLADSNSDEPTRRLRALHLFSGDLLAGIMDTGQDLEDWLRAERSILSERFFAAMTTALVELTRFGRASHAELNRLRRRMLALDPEREASYRALMEAYGRNGMFAEAEALWSELKIMLDREYGEKPSPETVSVNRKIAGEARMRGESPAVGPETRADLPRVAFLPPSKPSGKAQAPFVLISALIEDVAGNLSRYRTFRIIAPHSSFAISRDRERAASTLRADYVVSSFMVPGTQVLAMSALRVDDGVIAWSAEYTCDPTRLQTSFRLMSSAIASMLADAIERDRLSDSFRSGPADAYRHYLEGRILLRNADLPKLRSARDRFAKAASEGRRFGEARARIAQTLQLEWLMRGGSDPYLLQQAKAEAETAIEIDPGGGSGHWMAGVVALYQRDYDLSADKFLEAESLNPNSADLLVQHADALAHFGENQAGRERFDRAIDLNPLAPDHYWWAGASIAFNCRDYDEAIRLSGRMENSDPALRLLTASHALQGDIETARAYAARLRQLYPGVPARELVKLSPDRNDEANRLFLEGLRLAGIA